MGLKLTRDQVVACFIEKHEGLYDYSKFIWINSQTLSIVICRIHGEFKIRPNAHQQGQGCYHCGRLSTITASVRVLSEVLTEFRLKHKDLYDYTKFIYKNNRTKGIIICKSHGEFLMNVF